MVYDPTKDFVALWRASGGQVSKTEMPGLDFTIAALARAGLITLVSSATAPVANQATTAWLHTATPSSSAEGALNLWNATTSAYAAATPGLFLAFLQACAGESGISWWTSTGGAPLNTVGMDGDLAIRTDQPGGIYGPKVAGAWPAAPLPGTTTAFTSADLDVAFGANPGAMLSRGATLWQELTIGAANSLIISSGGFPTWSGLSALLDAVFGSAQGSVMYRDATAWNDLPPGTSGQFLQTQGAGANPAWAGSFPPGTVMLFQQTAAPTGWTKLTATDDAGLRVVAGAAGSTAGATFSSVFAQTATGGHQLTVAEMPSHSHTSTLDGDTPITAKASGAGITAAGVALQANADVAFSIAANGGDGIHTHPITLNLKYVDVILASKN